MHDLSPFWSSQVDAETPLVSMSRGKGGTYGSRMAALTAPIQKLRTFDLDYFSTLISKQSAGFGTHDDNSEVEDP